MVSFLEWLNGAFTIGGEDLKIYDGDRETTLEIIDEFLKEKMISEKSLFRLKSTAFENRERELTIADDSTFNAALRKAVNFNPKENAAHKDVTHGITREQWDKLKRGSILLSPSGKQREIISVSKTDGMKSSYISFENGVTYLYTDLYKRYSVFKY